MAALTFDTLKYSKRLEAAGIPTKAAEAQAEILSETLSIALSTNDLATNSHVEKVVADAKADIIKWLAALMVAQAAAIAALVKLL